jgi:hypothetical protein
MREDIKLNKNDEEPPFSDEEKRLYIAAYKKIEEQVDVNFYDPEKSFREIKDKISQDEKSAKNNRISWYEKLSGELSSKFGLGIGIQASTAVISFFVIGVMIGLTFQTSGPGSPSKNNSFSDSLRSGYKDPIVNKSSDLKDESTDAVELAAKKILEDRSIPQIEITKVDPIEFINLVINSGVEAGIVIQIQKINEHYLLHINNLKQGDPNQIGFKAIIGVPNSQDGKIKIRIQKK